MPHLASSLNVEQCDLLQPRSARCDVDTVSTSSCEIPNAPRSFARRVEDFVVRLHPIPVRARRRSHHPRARSDDRRIPPEPRRPDRVLDLTLTDAYRSVSIATDREDIVFASRARIAWRAADSRWSRPNTDRASSRQTPLHAKQPTRLRSDGVFRSHGGSLRPAITNVTENLPVPPGPQSPARRQARRLFLDLHRRVDPIVGCAQSLGSPSAGPSASL